jgi:hypothetical protein
VDQKNWQVIPGLVELGVVMGPSFCTKKFKGQAIILFNFELKNKRS